MATPKQAVTETDEQRRNREAVESIARNISSLARAVAALLGGPLNKKALLVLLSSSSGMPQSAVGRVLDALKEMESDWLRK